MGQSSCMDEEIKATSVLSGYFHDSLKWEKKNMVKEKMLISSASHLSGERASGIFGILSQKAMGASENLSSARVMCIILASGPFPIGHSPYHPTAYP